MALACRQARRLSLTTVAGHAREAERLELEAHLSSCARCSEEHGALSLVRRLREVASDTVSTVGRQNIRRALAVVGHARVAVPPRRVLWPFGAAAATSLAIVAFLGIVSLSRGSYRLLGGDVVASSALPAALSALFSSPVSFHANVGGRISVGDATAELASGTDVSWSSRQRTMTLGKGAVTVDVEHQVGRRFQVRTPHFIVEVVGTQFTVDLSGVRTHRGVVRVLRPNGTLVSRVEAGQSWHDDVIAVVAEHPGLTGAAAQEPSPEVVPIGPRGEPSSTTLRSPTSKPSAIGSSSSSRSGTSAATAVGTSLADRLVQGRRCLSRGDAITARHLVSPLFRQSRDLAVEARVLFAESFLVEGRYADAVDAYRIVARDFSRTDQAETSLFAVAQLESEHGRTSDARTALRSYLGRYPRGRFVREVSDRLNRLSSVD